MLLDAFVWVVSLLVGFLVYRAWKEQQAKCERCGKRGARFPSDLCAECGLLLPPRNAKEREAELQRLRAKRSHWDDSFIIGTVYAFLGLLLGLSYESYRWLQTGVWEPFRTSLIGFDSEWLRNPDSWHGLHRVVRWLLDVPAFVSFVFAAGLLYGFVGLMARGFWDDEISRWEKKAHQ